MLPLSDCAPVFSDVYFRCGTMIICRSLVTFSSIFDSVTAPTSIFLEWALLLISYRRRLYRQLTFFSIYVVVLAVYDGVNEWVSFLPLFKTLTWNYVYWSAQFAFALLRLLTIAEITRRGLRGYPAVWGSAWRLMSAAAVILLAWTTDSAIQNAHHMRKFIAVAGQRFEFMEAILLLLLLLLGAYYHVRISPLYRWILIGICIYSALLVANGQFWLLRTILGNLIFADVRRGAFLVPLVMWTYAVWRWGNAPTQPPELISQSEYDNISPQIHDRLRELNDKLTDLGVKRRR
jgi:hypothetical protein